MPFDARWQRKACGSAEYGETKWLELCVHRTKCGDSCWVGMTVYGHTCSQIIKKSILVLVPFYFLNHFLSILGVPKFCVATYRSARCTLSAERAHSYQSGLSPYVLYCGETPVLLID